MSTDPCPVTVVMPALNEAQNLAAAMEDVLGAFARHGVRGELLVVDDGSTDGTGAIADAWAARRAEVRVIHHGRPHGIGGAFWEGVRAARGEVVTMIPGDGENDAGEILRYLPLMEHVDLVVPFVFNPGVRPWRRRLLSLLYHEVIYLTTALTLNYLNGTVLYRRLVFEGVTLQSRGFFYQTELLLKTIGRRYLYAEVPCALRRRGRGRSKAVSLRSLAGVVRGYVLTLRDIYALRGRPAPVHPGSVTARRRRELAAAGVELDP